jgi:hypothetical protein
MLFTVAWLVLITVSLASFLVPPSTAAKCTKPTIRREWRKLSVAEKANWIQAVNVCKQ